MSGDEAYEEWLRDATDEEVDIEFGVQGMKYSDDGQVVSSGGWSVSQKEAIREQLTNLADEMRAMKPIDDPVENEYHNSCIDYTLLRIEAITKGDEQ